jgi:hypothetical protein
LIASSDPQDEALRHEEGAVRIARIGHSSSWVNPWKRVTSGNDWEEAGRGFCSREMKTLGGFLLFWRKPPHAY